MRKFICSLVLALTPSLSFAGPLNHFLSDTYLAYNWSCSGSACHSVVKEQVKALNALASYIDQFDPPYIVKAADGLLAKRVASKICNFKIRIQYEYLVLLINAENRVLTRLKSIQEGAGVYPRTCTKQIR